MRPLVAVLCATLAPSAFAQGFGGLFDKAPPHIDKALRGRIDAFFKAQQTKDWASAMQLVHKDSMNAFIGAEKLTFKAYKIISINWEENFTIGTAVIDLDTDQYFPGFGMSPVHRPLTSRWKAENGQWFWHVIPFDPAKGAASPFGPMFRGGDQPASGTAEAGSPLTKALESAPKVTDLLAKVTIDKTQVKLSSHEPSKAFVEIKNSFDGPITLQLTADDLPCLSVHLEKNIVPAGESAKVNFACTPDNPAKKVDGRALVRVDPLGKQFLIAVIFEYPPQKQ